MYGIEVIRNAGLKKGEYTQGIFRDKAFETKNVLFARSRVAGGVKSGWHHHGSRDLYGFLVSGRLRFDTRKDERDSVEVGAGDFFHIPVGLVHRDVNPDNVNEAVVVNVLLGEGPPVVNVQEP
jgi:uncharacterized RmlC-like cupin family protein